VGFVAGRNGIIDLKKEGIAVGHSCHPELELELAGRVGGPLAFFIHSPVCAEMCAVHGTNLSGFIDGLIQIFIFAKMGKTPLLDYPPRPRSL